jgi:hypothetical protein
MTVTLLFVLLAVAFVATLLYLARGGTAPARRGELQYVDMEAFKNLMDAGERAYLEKNLPAKEFRAIHRERQRSALEYIAAVSSNASALLILAQEARHSSDPEVVQAANTMIENATQVRVNAAGATFRIYLGLAFPSWAALPDTLADRYERLTRLELRLQGLRFRNAGSAA